MPLTLPPFLLSTYALRASWWRAPVLHASVHDSTSPREGAKLSLPRAGMAWIRRPSGPTEKDAPPSRHSSSPAPDRRATRPVVGRHDLLPNLPSPEHEPCALAVGRHGGDETPFVPKPNRAVGAPGSWSTRDRSMRHPTDARLNAQAYWLLCFGVRTCRYTSRPVQ